MNPSSQTEPSQPITDTAGAIRRCLLVAVAGCTVVGCTAGFDSQRMYSATTATPLYGNIAEAQHSAPQSAALSRPQSVGVSSRQPQTVNPSQIIPVSGTREAWTGTVQLATHFSPAEPRQECPPAIGTAYPVMEVVSGSALVHRYPDEYLFDGGDRGAKVHYTPTGRDGVETEDTFAEYIDHTGQRHVRASNQVAVYAPRFAAVRSLLGSNEDVKVDRLAMANDAIPGAGLIGRQAIISNNRRTKAGGMQIRQRGSEVETRDQGAAMATRTKVAGNVFFLKPLGRQRVQSGAHFDHANEAWLAKRAQNAAKWSHKSYPLIRAETSAAMDVSATFRPQQTIGVEDRKTKGHLQVVKLADVESAVAGDTITFTIRYTNLGGKDLYDVRIIDNLTPRLEFVPESAGSDRPGDVVVESNGMGSKLLRFELDGALKGGETGTIRFQAKVR